MLPEGLSLESGQEHIRVLGCNLPQTHFDTPEQLRKWADSDPRVRSAHQVLYFAHDNSGLAGAGPDGGTFIEDSGQYVAIRARGEGRPVVDAVLGAVEKRKKMLQESRAI